MKKVTIINFKNQEEPVKNPIEFTHKLCIRKGWVKTNLNPNDKTIKNIVYLGKCVMDGDMFAVYFNSGTISIFKGHLNDGTY